jgi:hypothetical protein
VSVTFAVLFSDGSVRKRGSLDAMGWCYDM